MKTWKQGIFGILAIISLAFIGCPTEIEYRDKPVYQEEWNTSTNWTNITFEDGGADPQYYDAWVTAIQDYWLNTYMTNPNRQNLFRIYKLTGVKMIVGGTSSDIKINKGILVIAFPGAASAGPTEVLINASMAGTFSRLGQGTIDIIE